MGTTVLLPVAARPGPVDETGTAARDWCVWAVAGLAVLVRLPFARLPAGADEAGFLQVAAQWAPGGGSLYGHYWVDRPPLLIALYQVADLSGGVLALRVIGCLAVAATVLLCAVAARSSTGPTGGRLAARWAALGVAALLVSPLLDGLEVNGELLSAPFVAGSIAALAAAARTPPGRRRLLLAALAGAAAVGALLIKQNIVDGAVFGSVLLFVDARRGTVVRAWALVAAAGAGALSMLVVVAGWATAHGTSLVAVFDATYPFRIEAAHVVAAAGSQYASGRAVSLATAFVTSGAALLTCALVLASVRGRAGDAAVLALGTTVAWDAVSIVLGGGYWLHYLIEAAVPLAIWGGVLAGRAAIGPRVATLVVTTASLLTLTLVSLQPSVSPGQQVGTAVADVARPHDTLTTLYGQAQVNLAAGLPSPYPYLWSLPIRTLDPQLGELDRVLAGPSAPTWLVVARHVSSWGLDTSRATRLITSQYRPVARIDGQTIYLHDGVVRATPTSSTDVERHPIRAPTTNDG